MVYSAQPGSDDPFHCTAACVGCCPISPYRTRAGDRDDRKLWSVWLHRGKFRRYRSHRPIAGGAAAGRFAGLSTYFDRGHLATAEVAEAWRTQDSFGGFLSELYNLPFYKALAFTLTYTFLVTPLVIVLGLLIALGVNRLKPVLKGPTIFVSLLPMIITPLIGSLILFWMIDAQGVIGKTLQWLFDDPELSLKASPTLTWITLMIYGVWSSAPFAFVVFYAGLQTVNTDFLEAAMIDGQPAGNRSAMW